MGSLTLEYTIATSGFTRSYSSDSIDSIKNTIAGLKSDIGKAKLSGKHTYTSEASCVDLFVGCNKLTTIDVSNFDTSNVTDMHSMFNSCQVLTSIIGLNNFDTSNVTDMHNMFAYCKALTTIDVSSFNTSNVTDMSNMFNSCNALTFIIGLNNFDTSSVTNMVGMFYGCDELISLNVSNFDTSNVTDMHNMFYYCRALTTIDVSSFNTSNVTDMSNMFNSCNALTSLDVSNFNTSNVTTMSSMFFRCGALTTIYCNKDWNTGTVTKSGSMFSYCNKLVGAAPYDSSKIDIAMANPTTGYFSTIALPVYINDIAIEKFYFGNSEVSTLFYNGIRIFPPEVPKQYRVLEYIESTGTQYIDTHYNANANTVWELNASFAQKNDAEQKMGIQGRSGYASRCAVGVLANDTMYYGIGEENYDSDIARDGEVHTYIVDVSNFNATYDDNTISVGTEYQQNPITSLVLFGVKNGSSDTIDTTRYCKAKLYYSTISENGEVIHEYIPVIRESDNKPGLYDTVDKVFLTNNGTGEFFYPETNQLPFNVSSSHTSWYEQENAVYIYDLGSVKSVDSFQAYVNQPSTENGSHSTQTLTTKACDIYISSDGTNYTKVGEWKHIEMGGGGEYYPFNGSWQANMTQNFSPAEQMRYIKLVVVGYYHPSSGRYNKASFSDVQIYGN